MTNDNREIIRITIEQAAKRNVNSVVYCESMIAVLGDGFTKYPDDEQKAYKHASALLNAKYPVVKGGGTA